MKQIFSYEGIVKNVLICIDNCFFLILITFVWNLEKFLKEYRGDKGNEHSSDKSFYDQDN